MEFLGNLTVWQLAVLIFFLRIGDVSIGTMRTVSVVNGRIKLSVLLGFLEVLLWTVAVSGTILRIQEDPVLPIAYAAGFAAGNGVGILLERKLALGQVAVRMISRQASQIKPLVESTGRVVASFSAEPAESGRTLLFTIVPRKRLPKLLKQVQAIDPELFWVSERFAEMSRLQPLPYASGWRSMFKMK